MPQCEQQNHDNAFHDALLYGDYGKNRGDKAECAGSGHDAVCQSQKQCTDMAAHGEST